MILALDLTIPFPVILAFPQGTDETYLQKQHAALDSHPYYSKGDDKTKWGTTFGIKHFAGVGESLF